MLHIKDLSLLYRIESFFGVGNISINAESVSYQVNSLKFLTEVIIPHFEKYPLLTQKRADFLLFKMVIKLMNQKEHLTIEGLRKIVSLRASINRGLSEELRESFPGIIPVERPLVEINQIPDPS
jgi:hypothetical protein